LIKYRQYVIFDTETTGLYPDDCQIIEFAALVLDENGKAVKEIDEFINAKYIPLKITELTGITMADTDSGISEQALLEIINEINVTQTLWIAHNAQFDLSFLRSTFERHNISFDEAFKLCDFLDTLTVYRDRKMKPHKLEDAIEYYECKGVENSHRAIDDVKALWAVIKAMTKERNDLGIYVNVFGQNNTTPPFEKITYKRQRYGFKDIGMRLPEI